MASIRLLAQPALPTTNQTFAPIANPYSGSWIFYTTNPASGLGFLNGASIPYVMTASNSIVTYVNTATNGLATTNFVLSQNYVTATVTNGLATLAYVNSSTNGFVTAAITNGLATTNYVRTATNGFVTAAITNGLATTNFILSQNYVTATVTNGLATLAYVNSSTNGFVTAAITNGLATTNFVLSQNYVTAAVTNGLASVSYVNTATNYVLTNALAQLNAASNALAGQIGTATTSALSPAAIWIGVSGGTLAVSSTHYAAPNNSSSMTATTDTTGITRAPVPESVTLTNLYVAISGALGSGHTATLTIMTNGVATPIAVTISGSSQTDGNDTTDSVTIPAGTLIGVRVVTGASINLRDWSWSFEGF